MIRPLQVITTAALLACASAAHPLEEWSLLAPLPTIDDLTGIALGDGRYVVTSGDAAGRALTSSDGEHFAFEPLGLPEGVAATRIAYKDGIWLAVAGGRTWIRSSWENPWEEGGETAQPVSEIRSLNDEFWAWSGGGFSGRGGARQWTSSELYRSDDGAEWTPVSVTGEFLAVSEIVFAEGRYVLTNAAFSNTTSGVWGSADGTAWQPLTGSRGIFNSVAHGNGRFLAGGEGGRIAHSEDGISWTSETFPFITRYIAGGGASVPVYADVDEIDFIGNRFLTRFDGSPGLAESADGVTWSRINTGGGPISLTSEIAGHVYYLGERGILQRSQDPGTAQQQLLPYQPWDWKGAAANATRLVVAGQGGNAAWSEDGTSFHHLQLPDAADVTDLVWAEVAGIFLAVGGNEDTARAWRSADGETWQAETISPFSNPANGVAWDGKQFIACGDDGQLARSSDGVSWHALVSGVTHRLDNIASGGGQFAAVGGGGPVIYSADGLSWKTASASLEVPAAHRTVSLTYGRGVWAINHGFTTFTTDFQTSWQAGQWISQHNPVFAFGEFIYCNGRYVRSTSDGFESATRYDGLHQVNFSYPTRRGFYRGTRFKNRIYFVGDEGLIGASAPWRDFFAEWRASQFDPAELSDETVSGEHADPDGDGWSNVFEYAFALDPKSAESEGASQLTLRHHESHQSRVVGDHFHFQHPWGIQPPGVSIWVEQSYDFTTWREAGLFSSLHRSGSGINPTDRVERTVPVRKDSSHYFRLRGEAVRP